MAMKAVAGEFSKQLAKAGMMKEEEGFVRKIPGIDELDKRVDHFGKQRVNDECEDMQADLQSMIPKVKMNELMKFLYSGQDGTIFKETPIPRFGVMSSLRVSCATGCRGEETRYHNLATMFTTNLKGIGIERDATALTFIGNEGKMNRCGRHVTQGVLPHINPLLCAVGASGLNFVYRFQVCLCCCCSLLFKLC